MSGLGAALAYLEADLSVIPVWPRDKRPLQSWKAYQVRRPTRPEVMSWWKRWPDAGVGVVCGRVSGLAVVDCDPRNGDGLTTLADRLPRTPTAETGGGGWHFYFRPLPGERLAKVPSLLPGIDLQGDGSYVIAPPSIHPSGRPYHWLPGRALGEVPLAPLPLFIRQLITLRLQRETEAEQSCRPMPRGTRLTLDAVLGVLRGVRRCGHGWVALCPAHDDQVPSLSVGDGGGRPLLHCFAGCTFGEILAALRAEAA